MSRINIREEFKGTTKEEKKKNAESLIIQMMNQMVNHLSDKKGQDKEAE